MTRLVVLALPALDMIAAAMIVGVSQMIATVATRTIKVTEPAQ